MLPPKLAMSMRCLIPLPAPSSHFTSGNLNGDTHASPQNHQTHETHGDSKVYFLQRQTRLSLNYGEHNPSHAQQHTLLSQLSHNPISSLYIFPFPRILQHKRKLNIPCCNKKNYHKNISTSTSWNFSLFYIPNNN